MAAPDPNELRPGDLLILYYLYEYGQGMVSHIAETIDRKREYTSRRTSVLESDEYGLVTRVMKDEGTVMLTPTGRTLIAEVKDTHLLPKQRAKIESELDYSVPGE